MLYLFSASVDTVSETTNQHESLQESLRVVEVYTFFLVLKFVFLKKNWLDLKKKWINILMISGSFRWLTQTIYILELFYAINKWFY